MRYIQIYFGNILITFAYACFCVPNNILNGGVTCMAIILANILHQDIAVCSTVLICALLLFCFFCLGSSRFQGSVFSGICYILLFAFFHTFALPIRLPVLITVTIAALLVGLGYGICICADATTLGFDTIALYLHKVFPSSSVSSNMCYINVLVMLAGSIMFGLSALLKGILFIGLQSFIMNIILQRQQRKENLYDLED